MDIVLYIEELVLHGFDPAEQRSLSAALQRELTRQLANTEPLRTPRLPPDRRTRNLASVDAGRFQVAAQASSQRIGTQAGQALATHLQNRVHSSD